MTDTESEYAADRGERDQLVAAVTELTRVVAGVDKLLRDDYPKRSEVERRFVTKLETKNYTVRLLLVALVTVVISYIGSTGAYSVCFVGDDNASVCKFVPGYSDRIDRKNQLDQINRINNARLVRIEKKLGIKPPDDAPGKGNN